MGTQYVVFVGLLDLHVEQRGVPCGACKEQKVTQFELHLVADIGFEARNLQHIVEHAHRRLCVTAMIGHEGGIVAHEGHRALVLAEFGDGLLVAMLETLEILAINGIVVVDAGKLHLELAHAAVEIEWVLLALALQEAVGFDSHPVCLVLVGDAGHAKELVAALVGEAGVDGLGLCEGKLEVLLLDGEPDHHLEVGLVVGVFANTLHQCLFHALRQAVVGRLKHSLLHAHLHRRHDAGRVVEEVEILLCHSGIVAHGLVDTHQLIEIKLVITRLGTCRAVGLDRVVGPADVDKRHSEVGHEREVGRDGLDGAVEVFFSLFSLFLDEIGVSLVDIERKLLGAAFKAFLGQLGSILVLAQLEVGGIEALVVVFIRSALIERLIKLCGLLELAVVEIIGSHLLLRLLGGGRCGMEQQ